MPAQTKVNNLALCEQPSDLSHLNSLELRLICQRIPFMKMVGLPRGKQHGPAVNVPAKTDVVCEQFPRLPSQCQLIPLKLKRRMKYKSHYMYDYVRPEKILSALRWLKANNKLYSQININDNWSSDALQDDPNLWRAMTGESNVATGRNDNEQNVNKYITNYTETAQNVTVVGDNLNKQANRLVTC